MILDQHTEEKRKPIVSGNNQLLKGAVFAMVTMVWFSFLFAFINVDWMLFSPAAPFYGDPNKGSYVFYFMCFSFFISSVVYSMIFYRSNLQPHDLLMRFGVILVVFLLMYLIYLLLKWGLSAQKEILTGGILYVVNGKTVVQLINIVVTFLFFYAMFYPVILIFSKLFFNGFFGTGGFILCFFLTTLFHVALYYLAAIGHKLDSTLFPMGDIVVILFFTLTAFGIGIVSGDEVKKKAIKRKL